MNALHYGVLVGINRYPDLRLLKRAKGDAEAFYEWLTDPRGGGVPSENVALVVVDDNKMPDGTPREAALPTRTRCSTRCSSSARRSRGTSPSTRKTGSRRDSTSTCRGTGLRRSRGRQHYLRPMPVPNGMVRTLLARAYSRSSANVSSSKSW